MVKKLKYYVVSAVVIMFCIFVTSGTNKAHAKDFTGTNYETEEGKKYDVTTGNGVSQFAYGQKQLLKVALNSTPNSEGTKNGYAAYGVTGNVSFTYCPYGNLYQSGNATEWHLVADSGKKVNGISIDRKIDKGVIIVQKSYDCNEWTTEATASISSGFITYANSGARTAIYSTNLDDLICGTYYRVTVAYKMEKQTGTQSAVSFLPFTPQVPVYSYIECVEEYEFYLGYDKSAVKFYDVMKNSPTEVASGSSVSNGFYLDKCGSNSTVKVSGVGNTYVLEDKKTVCIKGDYTLQIITEFGTQYSYSIKVTNGLKTQSITPTVYEGTWNNYYKENNQVSSTKYGASSYTTIKIAQADSANSFSTNTYNGFAGYGISGENVYLMLNLSDGKGVYQNDWKIINDTWGKNSWEKVVDLDIEPVATGALIVQKSNDGVNWEQVDNSRYSSGLYTTDFYNYFGDRGDVYIYSPSGDEVIGGIYLRVYYAYEVQKSGKSTTNTRYLEKYEFYLCSSNLGAITFHNLSLTDDDYNKSLGNNIETNTGDADSETLALYKNSETLTNGSVTLTGFEIDTSMNQTVSVSVKRDGSSITVPTNKKFKTAGKYEVILVGVLGDTLSTTIYVDNATDTEAVRRYFGDGFIVDKRIYEESDYPVFEGGYTSYNIEAVEEKYLPISGTITNTTTNETITIEATRTAKSGIISTPGEYVAVFNSNPLYKDDVHSGDNRSFTFRFSVIAQGTAPGPQKNKEFLENYAALNVTDAYPVYYGVTFPSASVGYITLAFATEESAFDFAYNYEKGMVEEENGTYIYTGSLTVGQKEIYESNWDVTDAVNYFARQAVQKLCFNPNYLHTYLTLSDEVIAAYPNLRTLELNSSVVVFANEDEKEALMVKAGYPVINDKIYKFLIPGIDGTVETYTQSYEFVHDKYNCDSESVVIVDSEGNEFAIEYNKSVGQQLKEAGCSTGIITIIEKTKYGDSVSYNAIYYADESNASITRVTYQIDGIEMSVEYSADDCDVELFTNAFTIDGIVDELEKCGLLYIVSPDGSKYMYSSDQIVTDYFVEEGTYDISVTNRMGYGYSFKVTVSDSDYVRISFQGDGTEQIRDIITFEGQQNVSLPIIEREGYTFNGYIDQDGNIYIDNISVVGEHSLILSASWEPNVYTITFTYSDGTVYDSIEVVYGESYTLPVPSVGDDEMFVSWILNGTEVDSEYYVSEANNIVMVANIVTKEEYSNGAETEQGNNDYEEESLENIVDEIEESSVRKENNNRNIKIIVIVTLMSLVLVGIIIVTVIMVNKRQKRSRLEK